ncbi:MAG: DUF2157 domain-containing protein, partial [Cardiobacteriaceae bacterium]|nr:DUF2157 domain-containing protein [Cardiobacteriaceae bacterium]
MNRRAIFSHELLIELPHWESMGWISPEQAALLRSQYAIQTKSSDPWWHLVLSLFAILCVAAGVIALFASNWASLSRNVRVVLSLTPLLISQIALYSTFVRHPKSTAWRECSTLAVALSVGASIALIGQTYHVEADFSTFLRTWLWLILPLPYVARSWTAVFFAAFLTHLFGFSVLENGFYVSQSAAFFLHDASWEYLIYVLALLPWLYWQRRRKAFYGEQRHVWRTFSVTHTISFAVALTFSNIFDGFVPIWFCI